MSTLALFIKATKKQNLVVFFMSSLTLFLSQYL